MKTKKHEISTRAVWMCIALLNGLFWGLLVYLFSQNLLASICIWIVTSIFTLFVGSILVSSSEE